MKQIINNLENNDLESSKSVLILDDQVMIPRFIKNELINFRQDLNIVLSSDPISVLSTLHNSNFNFDLFILDVNLPVISGFEVAKMVREFNSEVEILLMSGSDYTIRANGLGFSFVSKRNFAREVIEFVRERLGLKV